MSFSGAIRAGGAFIELFADDSKLRRDLKKAGGYLHQWGASIASMGGKILLEAGLGVVTPALAMAKAFAAAGDELDKMSIRTGFAVESLSALNFAASQSGTSLADLERSIRFMQRVLHATPEQGKLNELLAAGAGDRAMRALNLDLQKLRALSPEKQFLEIADAIGKIEDPGERAAAAMKIFGEDSGTKLVPLLQDGAGGVRELMELAERLGIVMSGPDSKAAAAFTDAMDQLWRQFAAIRNMLGAAIAPLLTRLIKHVEPWVMAAIKWADANRDLVRTIFIIGAAAAAAGAALVGLGSAIIFLGMIVSNLGVLAGVAASVFSAALLPALKALWAYLKFTYITPLHSLNGAIISLARSAGNLFFLMNEGLVASVAALGAGFSKAFGAARAALAGMWEALKSGDFEGALAVLVAGAKAAWSELLVGFRRSWIEFRNWLLATWDEFKTVIIAVGAVFLAAFPMYAVVAAFVGSIAIIYTNWDTLVENLKLLWAGFTDFLTTELSGVVSVFNFFWTGLKLNFLAVKFVLMAGWDAVIGHWKEGGAGFKGWITTMWAGLKVVWLSFTTGLEIIWIELTAKIKSIWNAVANFLKTAWLEMLNDMLKATPNIGKFKQWHDAVKKSLADIQREEDRGAKKRLMQEQALERINRQREKRRKLLEAADRLKGLAGRTDFRPDKEAYLKEEARMREEARRIELEIPGLEKILFRQLPETEQERIRARNAALGRRDEAQNRIVGERDRDLENLANERFIKGALRDEEKRKEIAAVEEQAGGARQGLADELERQADARFRAQFRPMGEILAEERRRAGLGAAGGEGPAESGPAGTFDPNALRGLGQNDPRERIIEQQAQMIEELRRLKKLDDLVEALRQPKGVRVQ